METEEKPSRIGGIRRLPTPVSRLKLPQITGSKRSRSPEDCAKVAVPNPGKKFRPNPPAESAKNLKRSVSANSFNTRSARVNDNTVPAKRNIARPSTKPLVSKPAVKKGIVAPASKRSAPPTSKRPPAPPPAAEPSSGGSKKRAAWDMKGRLQDMEKVLHTRNTISLDLQNKLDLFNSRINSLESQNNQLTGTVAEKEQFSSEITRENEEVIRKLRKCREELDDITFSKSTLQRQKESLEGELTAVQCEVSGLKSAIAELTSAQVKVGAELENTKLSLGQSEQAGREKDTEVRRQLGIVAELKAVIEEQTSRLRDHETERRKLHNMVQELKGNIRVFCRVRPLIGDETIGNDGIVQNMNFPDVDGRIMELEKVGDMSLNESSLSATRRGQNKHEFTFDKVFQPDSTQASVFEEISQLVQSALDGYNVCIFAYGQTGSGKTYTMEGLDVDNPETMGMIPRAVQQIFTTAASLEEKGWQYQFDASMLEIYNETIRDLLGEKDDLKHEIKMSGSGGSETVVSNITIVPVTSQQQVHKLLKKSTSNRAVAETKCNERSSRSHSVFQLKLKGVNEVTSEKCAGILSLVDLAGSERIKESGAQGQRLKETLHINSSLSNLGNVIMALGNQDSHIPYRNSKLTYLLQNSLGGNSKTLMFVNVSPKEECFQETINSLRFATKVNQCNIGTAKKKSK